MHSHISQTAREHLAEFMQKARQAATVYRETEGMGVYDPGTGFPLLAVA